ncbi:MAG TPA: hypothetical protein DCM45_00835 [Clostridiales bacterium]|nr:hypothetical protein [Clostridiales bacterium]
MKRYLKFFSVITILFVTIFTFAVTASAETCTQVITGGSSWAVYGKQTTSYVPYCLKPVYESQALHTQGYSTTISVSSAVTLTASSSVSLTAGVDAVFADLSITMEVGSSVAYTTGSSVSYTIGASTASGRYRIEHIYPQRQVLQQRIFSDSSGETIQWQ